MGDFSLVPSIIVLGIVLVGLAAVSTVMRRRAAIRSRERKHEAERLNGARAAEGHGSGTGGLAPVRLPVDELRTQAGSQLVRMDDVLHDAALELQFAAAEFGAETTHDFAAALATARQRAAEAFQLQQRLDDHVPDSEQQQRDWSKRILSLSDAAIAAVGPHTRRLGERRRSETTAPAALDRTRAELAAARRRLPAAAATLAGLGQRYAPRALAAVRGTDADAAAALDTADTELTAAEAALADSGLAAVARQIDGALARIRTAVALLDAVDRMPQTLAEAEQARSAARTAATTQLADAAALRDAVEDPDAARAITEASARLRTLTTPAIVHAPPAAPLSAPAPGAPAPGSTDPGRATDAASPAGAALPLDDPAADVDALAAATAALDDTLAVARSAQQRLDSAREALVGALAIARSHIRSATDAIDGRRARVGADARTRLASAHRELAEAEQQADPVAALDAARRAATRATDAEALARYDAAHR